MNNFINLNNISNTELFISLCVNEINKLPENSDLKKNINSSRSRYTESLSFEYYLKMILIASNLKNWKLLASLKECKSDAKNHFKTIYNKFLYWSKKNIFKNAFENFQNNNSKTTLMLIDATCINNLNGKENITINPEYKKKK